MPNEEPELGRGATHRVEFRERDTVVPLELFFDLVFVLGFTQCTALMTARSDWIGLGQGMLVLAVIWWAWVLYTWLTSVIDPEEGPIRLVMLGAAVTMLIVALNTPEAFGSHALGFALAYGVVRLGHVALYLLADHEKTGIRTPVVRIAVSTVIAVGLLVAASFADGSVRIALWCLVIAVDFGTAMIGDPGWRIVPSHFAERHNLIVIIALGESIVALGAGADVELTFAVVVAAALGATLAAALWWMYFDVVALVTERRLEQAPEGRRRMVVARDSYAYLHFPMIAGIVLGAFGLEQVLQHVDQPLDWVHATALLGGTALYLLAHVTLRLRNARTLNRERLAAAVVLALLVPVAVHVEALVSAAAINVVVWAVVAFETFYVYDERRFRLRHGLEIDVP